jgi:hypothetical protein
MPTNPVKRVPPRGSRILYPTLPTSFTPADLNRLFGPSHHDRRWAPTVARTPASQVVMLVQLGIFRTLGRFLPIEEIPICVIDYLALELDCGSP